MIEAQGLTRYYGKFAAVDDVSFSIDDREIVGLLGLNGAGKSTTLKILAGLLLPSSGTVTIGGVDASMAPDDLRKRIGFLPEDPPLYREMRVDEFLTYCGELKGRTRAQIKESLPEVLETCQLQEVQHQVIDELSHGFRKRVGIAQAIIHRPQLVILDEPISGLDPKQIVDMREVVRALKKHATVIISSHILGEIAATCDRILVIHGGKLVAEGTEQDLAGGMAAHQRLQLRLRATVKAVEKVLDASGLVEAFEVTPGGEGLADASVTLTEDSRESLVKELVAAGVGIRTMTEARSELEGIFLKLTHVKGGQKMGYKGKGGASKKEPKA